MHPRSPRAALGVLALAGALTACGGDGPPEISSLDDLTKFVVETSGCEVRDPEREVRMSRLDDDYGDKAALGYCWEPRLFYGLANEGKMPELNAAFDKGNSGDLLVGDNFFIGSVGSDERFKQVAPPFVKKGLKYLLCSDRNEKRAKGTVEKAPGGCLTATDFDFDK